MAVFFQQGSNGLFYQGVGDFIQVLQPFGISEDQFAQYLTVDTPVRVHDLIAEHVGYPGADTFILEYAVANLVGVNDINP
ncbi:MAG: hypothetical protein EGMGGAKC_00159 [Dehalococcoides mccartyi]|nr:hypothetical protein [Dehalococcoides mccartyi]